jgi:hypothetical protein
MRASTTASTASSSWRRRGRSPSSSRRPRRCRAGLASLAANDRPARPDHPVTGALLDLLGQPLLATTLIPPGESEPMNDPALIRERFEKSVQAIVDAGACPMQPTTVIDLSGDAPVVVRLGRGDPALLGLTVEADA